MKESAEVERRAVLSGGISGGAEYYSFAIRGFESALPGSRILDLGCGTGGFGCFLAERFGVHADGVDVIRYEGFVESAYASLHIADLDLLEAKHLEGRRDFVFALGVIEHLTNPRRFIHAAAALLKPGGHLVVTAPNPASLRSLTALLRSGEYSAFKEASNPASITPVLAVDAARMHREARLTRVETTFSDRGTIPGCGGMRWQRVLPFAGGRWFSDNFRVTGVAP
jgi:2-polyprenyl-3-methyl-5-hydroxy-6-metoxy-1,4-benzoquinol methylase